MREVTRELQSLLPHGQLLSHFYCQDYNSILLTSSPHFFQTQHQPEKANFALGQSQENPPYLVSIIPPSPCQQPPIRQNWRLLSLSLLLFFIIKPSYPTSLSASGSPARASNDTWSCCWKLWLDRPFSLAFIRILSFPQQKTEEKMEKGREERKTGKT